MKLIKGNAFFGICGKLEHTITSQKHDFGAQVLLLTENVGFELIDGSLVLMTSST